MLASPSERNSQVAQRHATRQMVSEKFTVVFDLRRRILISSFISVLHRTQFDVPAVFENAGYKTLDKFRDIGR